MTTTLLRIDASMRGAGSYTRELTTYAEERWRAAHPGGRVVRRCVASEPIPHLSEEARSGFHREPTVPSLSDRLIAEWHSADEILMGSPLYNFSMPSTLKAYLDHIVREGKTFAADGDHVRGLCAHQAVTIITARGGHGPSEEEDYQTGGLTRILRFLGITKLAVVAVAGTTRREEAHEAVAQAKRRIDSLFAPHQARWYGAFTDEDKRQLQDLRRSQEAAIMAGDAEAYAALCTEDILLSLSARALVSGRHAFLEAERALFSSARLRAFRKTPLHIERSGDLAVELGLQEVESTAASGQDVFAARQKYVHVFRKTAQGWRYAVLSSNASE